MTDKDETIIEKPNTSDTSTDEPEKYIHVQFDIGEHIRAWKVRRKRKTAKKRRARDDRRMRPEHLDINKALVTYVVGNRSDDFEAIITETALCIPVLDKSWQWTDDPEDKITTFKYLRDPLTQARVPVPWYICVDGHISPIPIKNFKDAEMATKEPYRFSVDGKASNEMLDLYLDKKVGNEVYRKPHDWVTTGVITFNGLMLEFVFLKGDNLTETQAAIGIVGIVIGLTFLVVWSRR